MTDSITPPRLATFLLRLFASEPDFPQIEGDLSEEFHQLLSKYGPNIARRSYWREAFRNIWALAKRSSTIEVISAAALSVFVSVFSVEPFSRALGLLDLTGSTTALTLLLLYLFNGIIAMALGVLMSRLLRCRERLLQLAVTGLYLLYIMCGYIMMGPPMVLNRYFVFNLVNWTLVLSAFWTASEWIKRRRLRRLAG